MKIDLIVPTSWGELTGPQVEFIGRLVALALSESEIRTSCFIRFAGLKVLYKHPAKVEGVPHYLLRHPKYGRFLLDIDRFSDCVSRMKFLTEGIGLFRLPAVYCGLKARDSRLYETSFEEYILLDNAYMEFLTEKRVEALTNMMAVMYREPSDSPASEGKISMRKKKLAALPFSTQIIIYLWYTGAKQWLIEKYPNVFGKEGSGNSDQAGVILAMLRMVNGGVVANNQQTYKANIHEVLDLINSQMERNRNV